MAKSNTSDSNGTPDLSNLDQTVIAIPLLNELRNAGPRKGFYIIIDLNLLHAGGLAKAKKEAAKLIDKVLGQRRSSSGLWGVDQERSRYTPQFLFARLNKSDIMKLVRADGGREFNRTIYKIWPDFEVAPLLTRTNSTIKADAARVAFSAAGQDIVWAVIDSGIDGTHPHFAKHENLNLDQHAPIQHFDFAAKETRPVEQPTDDNGHGTHVAGIIAGEGGDGHLMAVSRYRDESGNVAYRTEQMTSISGVAPKCKLVSLKVLDAYGAGRVSSLMAALGYVHEINGYGRWTRVHGVNMSVGHQFDAEWFGCGQSPLCIEVDRLVRSGVLVVVAAGNSGYGFVQAKSGPLQSGIDLTINDPGNAELAITVGSTHREMPHVYGVSYFSSKGPTGDGRLKPDLVAPGEKVISCAAGRKQEGVEKEARTAPDYLEESGTSMAAPHVSGCIAAFLSIRREFRGRPERAKEIFLSTATDLKRERYFQGHGLVDLMRAIQSV